jgi:RNA polymerase sigma-70 factor (ECF subfamily)
MTTPKERVYQQLLVVRCQRGDRQAMDELVTWWEKRLFYYIRRIVDQEADTWDVLQKTWIRVIRGIGSLKDPRSFSCWLYTLARNTSLSHLRSRGVRRVTDRLERCEDLPAEDEPTPVFEDAEAIHHALGRLSLAHREVLALFFLEDLSIEELGRVIGVPEGTVKSRLYYARRALRDLIVKEGER